MLSGQSFELGSIAAVAARFKLPWSHYVRLLSVRNLEARRFYEEEALRGGWTIRQIDRQIGSQFYERTALSRNKVGKLSILLGTKLLVSHKAGVFGGLGYDYQRAWLTSQLHVEGSHGSPQKAVIAGHNVTLGIGFKKSLGPVELAPELDVLYAPVQSVHQTNPTVSSPPSGSEWVIFPSVTFAVRAERRSSYGSSPAVGFQ